MTASRIGDLKMYVMLNELLPNRGPNLFTKNVQEYIYLIVYRWKYFLLTIAFETVICKIY